MGLVRGWGVLALQALGPLACSGLLEPWWALVQSEHSPWVVSLRGQVVGHKLLVALGLQQLLQHARPQGVGALG